MSNARAGYDALTWGLVKPFGGHCATPHDVEEGRAVFALSDTFNGRVIEMEKPQPVIWYGEDEEFAAVVVQAESHESEDGVTMDVIGLLLPNGDSAVALQEDIEPVSADDPVWLSLLDAEMDDGTEDDDDDADWATYGADDDDDDLS
ncbi:MAG: hypothetical protein ACXW3D_06310 [Caulobacteraceae bacterium]